MKLKYQSQKTFSTLTQRHPEQAGKEVEVEGTEEEEEEEEVEGVEGNTGGQRNLTADEKLLS